MGWNGSGGGTPQRNVKQGSAKPHNLWWLVAIIILGAIVATFVLVANREEDKRSESDAGSRKIVEVKHTRLSETKIERDHKEPVVLPPLVHEEPAPIVHKARTTTNKYPRRVIQPRQKPPKRFEHTSDELIAHLIETRPGATVVGYIPFERFEGDFRASIADPIKVKDDDSDYDKELKVAVSETRKEIAKLMGEGRSFADIMQESRTELQSLAQYKYQLMDELRKIKNNPETTDEDYSSFVEAANAMLESKGIAPIKMPRLLYRQLKFQENISEGDKE